LDSLIENNELQKKENLFRKFQIDKYNRKRLVPCVSMTIDICLENLQNERTKYKVDAIPETKISLTHVLIKAVAQVLKQYPYLYGYFDGKKIILQDKVKITLPVAENNHVEYVVIESPELKSLKTIASEVKAEINHIRHGQGKFYLSLIKLYSFPRLIRYVGWNNRAINIKFANGNFVITNFGSFNVKNGVPIISSPIVGILCLGMAQINEMNKKIYLPVTLVFDHRPIDGSYGGNFLNSLKETIENRANTIFD
jgi:pyruvate/2-oxoglutarate dehydrogenase complex dihydrolipoamide acyltransferase (E2) component